MEQHNAEQAAFTMMSEASHGQDISRRYNSLSSDEQKQVFSEMKNLQMNNETSKLFGNIDLFDSNNDGRMDDAKWAGRNGITRDVYDPNADRVADNSTRRSQENGYQRVQYERPADEEAKPAKAIENLSRQNGGEQPANERENIQARSHQPENSFRNRYGEYGAGNRNHDQEYRRDPNSMEERVGRHADNTLRRAGEIVLGETIRGMTRGGRHGPSIGDRIERRLGQQAQREIYQLNRLPGEIFRRSR